jgi:hypothetical protein
MRISSKLKKISLLTLIMTMLSAITVYAADTWSGGFPASKVAPLYFNWHTNDTYGQAYIYPAAHEWDAISSKVWASWTTTSTPNVNVYASTTSQSGLLGKTFPYYYNIWGNLTLDTGVNHTWATCDIYGYYDQMQANNMTDPQIIENYAHEFGHSLSLAHPADSSVAAVINQGIQSIKPTSKDKTNLKAKWGN